MAKLLPGSAMSQLARIYRAVGGLCGSIPEYLMMAQGNDVIIHEDH